MTVMSGTATVQYWSYQILTVLYVYLVSVLGNNQSKAFLPSDILHVDVHYNFNVQVNYYICIMYSLWFCRLY